jgi:hypothetical protein
MPDPRTVSEVKVRNKALVRMVDSSLVPMSPGCDRTLNRRLHAGSIGDQGRRYAGGGVRERRTGKALRLISEAEDLYRAMGMPRHLALVQALHP